MSAAFLFLQHFDPFALPMSIKCVCPKPDEYGFPSGLDLNAVCIFGMTIIQFYQPDIMIPYRHVFIAFPAADPIRIKPDNTDRMRTERDQPKEPKAVR